MGQDFFISYKAADCAWAEWTARQFEAAGYTVVLQAWDFAPSSNFILEVDKATGKAERTVLVISEHSLASPFVRAKWAARLHQGPAGEVRALVLVRTEACGIAGLLSPAVDRDMVSRGEAQATKGPLNGMVVGRHEPATAPGFPGQRCVLRRGPPPLPSRVGRSGRGQVQRGHPPPLS